VRNKSVFITAISVVAIAAFGVAAFAAGRGASPQTVKPVVPAAPTSTTVQVTTTTRRPKPVVAPVTTVPATVPSATLPPLTVPPVPLTVAPTTASPIDYYQEFKRVDVEVQDAAAAWISVVLPGTIPRPAAGALTAADDTYASALDGAVQQLGQDPWPPVAAADIAALEAAWKGDAATLRTHLPPQSLLQNIGAGASEPRTLVLVDLTT
jgi:hypothetical protein